MEVNFIAPGLNFFILIQEIGEFITFSPYLWLLEYLLPVLFCAPSFLERLRKPGHFRKWLYVSASKDWDEREMNQFNGTWKRSHLSLGFKVSIHFWSLISQSMYLPFDSWLTLPIIYCTICPNTIAQEKLYPQLHPGNITILSYFIIQVKNKIRLSFLLNWKSTREKMNERLQSRSFHFGMNGWIWIQTWSLACGNLTSKRVEKMSK